MANETEKKVVVDYTLKLVVSTMIDSCSWENAKICMKMTKAAGEALFNQLHNVSENDNEDDYMQHRCFFTEHLCDNQYGQSYLFENYEDGTTKCVGGFNYFTEQAADKHRAGSATYIRTKKFALEK